MSIIPGPYPGNIPTQSTGFVMQQQPQPQSRPPSALQQRPISYQQRPQSAYDPRGYAPQQPVYRQSQPPPQRQPSYTQPAYPYQPQQIPQYSQPQHPAHQPLPRSPSQTSYQHQPVQGRPQSALFASDAPRQPIYNPQYNQPPIQNARPVSYHGPPSHHMQRAPSAQGMQRVPSAQNLQQISNQQGMQRASSAQGMQRAPSAQGMHRIPSAQNLQQAQGMQRVPSSHSIPVMHTGQSAHSAHSYQQQRQQVQRAPSHRPTSSQGYARAPVSAPSIHSQIQRPQSQVHPVPSGPSSSRVYGPGTWTPQEVLYPEINRAIIPPQQPVYQNQQPQSAPVYQNTTPAYPNPYSHSPTSSYTHSPVSPNPPVSPFRASSPGLFGPTPFSTSQENLAFESNIKGSLRAASPGVHVRPLSPSPNEYARAASPNPGGSHINSRPLPTPNSHQPAGVMRSNTTVAPARDRPQSVHVQSQSHDFGANQNTRHMGLGTQFEQRTPVKSTTLPPARRDEQDEDRDQTPTAPRRASPVKFTPYSSSASPTTPSPTKKMFTREISSSPQKQREFTSPSKRTSNEPVPSTQFVSFTAKSNPSPTTGFTNSHGAAGEKLDLTTLGEGLPSGSGTKFVPLWKRELALSRATSGASSNSVASNSSDRNVETSSRRALPSSPTKTPDFRSVHQRNHSSQTAVGLSMDTAEKISAYERSASPDKNSAGHQGNNSSRTAFAMNTAEKISAYERSRSVSPDKGIAESGSGRALPQAPGGKSNAILKPLSQEEHSRRNPSNTSSKSSNSSMHSRAPATDSRLEDIPSSEEQESSRRNASQVSSTFSMHSQASTTSMHSRAPAMDRKLDYISSSEESESDVESDSHSVHSRPEASPQYGIRDLPRARDRIETFTGMKQPVPPPMVRGVENNVNINSSQKTRHGGPRPTQSMTLRMAALGLDDSASASTSSDFSSTSNNNASGSSSWKTTTKAWPADVEPLPRLRETPSSASSSGNRQSVASSSGNRQSVDYKRHTIDLDDAPPVSFRRSPAPHGSGPVPVSQARALPTSSRALPSHPPARQQQPEKRQPPIPHMNIESPAPTGGRDQRADIPRISASRSPVNVSGPPSINISQTPSINISQTPSINISNGPSINVSEAPSIKIDGDDDDDNDFPMISVSEEPVAETKPTRPHPSTLPPVKRRGGLVCGGCDGAIIGRIVNAMGARWHPECFRCTQCDTLLEHVSSYEHLGRPYCHLDYHENFAPRCYTCKTAIIEERFISLDDPEMGKRTYHEQHFFCAECGDPFLSPEVNSGTTRTGELAVSGDGVFEDDDVGFTVYKGHPYCEPCHVRLRMPKCKRCKKSIRDGKQAVEALGGKWCWECFVCAGCEKPFEDPSFFQRNEKPFCESCFSIILRNEI